MKLKNKLYLTQIFVIFIFIVFIWILYITFKKHTERDLEAELLKSVHINTLLLRSTLEDTYKTFEQRKGFIEQIHRTALYELQKEENISLEELKDKLVSIFDLKGIDIDLYLIDKDYVIVDATFKKDIGLDFKEIPDAKDDLDKASKYNEIHIASNVAIDYMGSSIKTYSYARTHNDTFLELAFIDPFIYNTLHRNISDISKSTNVKINIFRITDTASGEEYYEDILSESNISNKKIWNDSQKRFSLNTTTDDEIINVHRQDKILRITDKTKGTIATTYIPLHTKGNENPLDDNHFVLKLEIDITKHLAKLEENKKIFIAISLLLLLSMITLYYFIKNNFYIPITHITQDFEDGKKVEDPYLLSKNDEFGILAEKYNALYEKLQNQIKSNQHLLNENRQFIADMVHQIRTPLSVIMTNASLIEMTTQDQVSSYTKQINSAINMLSNSYEDLAYLITNDTIEYKPVDVHLSALLHERIAFFEVIAEANEKTIVSDVAIDIHLYMNDIELERLIDNNLSNAIKHSHDKCKIKVILKKVNSEIILQFISEGRNIYDVSKIFEKNYTESYGAKRSLGLGLNMVKTICEKNDIYYAVNSINHLNTFTYIFKG